MFVLGRLVSSWGSRARRTKKVKIKPELQRWKGYFYISSLVQVLSWTLCNARAQEKVPVTQTLSFCQMHFLSPLPVAFDRKLVSVIPVTARAPSKKEVPQEWVTLRPGLLTGWTLSTNQLESRTKSHTYSWGLLSWGFLLVGGFARATETSSPTATLFRLES